MIGQICCDIHGVVTCTSNVHVFKHVSRGTCSQVKSDIEKSFDSVIGLSMAVTWVYTDGTAAAEDAGDNVQWLWLWISWSTFTSPWSRGSMTDREAEGHFYMAWHALLDAEMSDRLWNVDKCLSVMTPAERAAVRPGPGCWIACQVDIPYVGMHATWPSFRLGATLRQ